MNNLDSTGFVKGTEAINKSYLHSSDNNQNVYDDYVKMLKGVRTGRAPAVYETKKEQPVKVTKEEIKKTSREAFTVFLLANAKMPEFYEYEPETIQSELKLDLLELEELLCCQNIWHNLTPFTDWHIFEKTVVVLNQRNANFLVTQDITPSEICFALLIMRQIDDHSLFSDEVLQFIAVILHNEGFITLPEIQGYNFTKEESYTGISLQFYLNHLNKHHEVHSKESQSEVFNNMIKYVEDRMHKFSVELKEKI